MKTFVLLFGLLFATAARAFVPIGYVWSSSEVLIQLKLQNTGPAARALSDGSTSWTAVARRALDTWNQQLTGTKLVASESTVGGATQLNLQNEVTWGKTVYGETLDANILGVTVIWAEDDGGMEETDIIFNSSSSLTWDSYRGKKSPSGSVDFQRVAIHELGHVLGLDHPDEGGQTVSAIMNSVISDIDAPTADDIAGIQSLYGPSTPPAITTQPADCVVVEGENARFAVTVSGSPTLHFRWKRDGVDLYDVDYTLLYNSTGVTYGGTDTKTLSLRPASAATIGSYTVTVSNRSGSVTSAPAKLSLSFGISRQPEDRDVRQGDSVTLSVAVTSASPVTYQWRDNGSDIVGATSDTLVVDHVTRTGRYSVVVTSGERQAVSRTATVRVALGFETQPSGRDADIGSTVTLSSSVLSTPGFNAPGAIAFDAAGNLCVADSFLIRIARDGQFTSSNDGFGASWLAIGPGGGVYLTGNGQCIWRLHPSGAPERYAGEASTSGSRDGARDRASFAGPQALAFDAAGNLYVCDPGNATIRRITPSGLVTTYAGGTGEHSDVDGSLASARFTSPRSLAFDSGGNLYVGDSGSGLIRRISPQGVVSTLAGSAALRLTPVDGRSAEAGFFDPTGLAVDAAGNLYVADRYAVRRVTPDGIVTTLAGDPVLSGMVDATGRTARFTGLRGLTLGPDGALYVSDNKFIRRVTLAGEVTTFAGSGDTNPQHTGWPVAFQWNFNGRPIPGATAANLTLAGFTEDQAGAYTVTISNPLGSLTSGVAEVRARPQIVSAPRSVFALPGEQVTFEVVARSSRPLTYQWRRGLVDIPGATGPSLTVTATPSNLPLLYSVVVSNGQLAVETPFASLDISLSVAAPRTSLYTFTGSVLCLRVLANTTVASPPRFNKPTSLAFDAQGDLIVCDRGNHTLRRLSLATGLVSTLAGSAGLSGSADGTGSNARFRWPSSLVVRSNGDIIVSDAGNATLRRVTPAGVVTTLAGLAGQYGLVDGVGESVRLRGAIALTLARDDTVYFADGRGHVIRKLTPDNQVRTVAGAYVEENPRDGVGAEARFLVISDLAIDPAGNVLIGDARTLRKLTADGTVTTLGGVADDYSGQRVDGPLATARFASIECLTVAPSGAIYLFDGGRPRRVSADGIVTSTGCLFSLPDGSEGEPNGFGADDLLLGPDGVIYFASAYLNCISTLEDAVATVLAGSGRYDNFGSTDGLLARYRWQLDGRDIPGATRAGLTLRNPTTLDASRYSVVVTTGYGQAESSTSGTIYRGLAPQILQPPSAATAMVASALKLQGAAAGTPPLSYRWEKDGATIPGAAAATLDFAALTFADSGSYRFVVSNAYGSATSAAATLTVVPNSRLVNVSVRASAGLGEKALLVGFVITGTGSKQALLRGLGPTLLYLQVKGALTDSFLTVKDVHGITVASNDNGGGSPDLAAITSRLGAYPIATGSRDAAIFADLPVGLYTMQVSGVNNTTGIALAEAYDADSDSATSKIINVSARNQVGAGEDALFLGFVVGGSAPKRLLIRAVGPSLASQGVAAPLLDPLLTLYDEKGNAIASNDDWISGTATAADFSIVGAFALPLASKDSALVVTVPPGVYSAMATGNNGLTGIALIEIYEMP